MQVDSQNPCENKLIQVEFQIHDDPRFYQTFIQNNRYLLKYYVEGEIKIFIDNQLWFIEEHLGLIEFGSRLNTWLNEMKVTDSNFEFLSTDYDEPIFIFEKDGRDHWQLFSPWQQYQLIDPIAREDLLVGFAGYLEALNKVVMEKFNITLQIHGDKISTSDNAV